MLGQLDAAVLAQHAAAIVARLKDSNSQTRCYAVQLLGTLEAAALAQHEAAVVARLGNSDADVRLAAVEVLGLLEVAALTLSRLIPHRTASRIVSR